MAEKISTVSVNQYDKYTVAMLNRALKHIDNKLSDKTVTLDNATIKKLEGMKDKYAMQVGKTQNLYNKYMKNDKTKACLKGLSVNTLSVQRIYQLLGKETKDNAVGAWLRESPGRAVALAGGGAILAGMLVDALPAIGQGIGNLWKTLTAEGGGLGAMLQQMFSFSGVASTLIGAGVLAIGVGLVMNKIQKEKFKNAHLQAEAEEAMNKGTVKDNDTLKKATPDLIKELAAEASADPNLMEHLMEVVGNPFTPPDVAKNAQAILDQAKIYEQQNQDRAYGATFQNILEIEAKTAEGATLSSFAMISEVYNIVQEQDNCLAAVDKDPTVAGKKSDMDKAKLDWDGKIADFKAAEKAWIAKGRKDPSKEYDDYKNAKTEQDKAEQDYIKAKTAYETEKQNVIKNAKTSYAAAQADLATKKSAYEQAVKDWEVADKPTSGPTFIAMDSAKKDLDKAQTAFDNASTVMKGVKATERLSTIRAAYPTLDTEMGLKEVGGVMVVDQTKVDTAMNAGYESIVKEAAEKNLPGFAGLDVSTMKPAEIKAKYNELKTRYGVDKAIGRISEAQLRLGGIEQEKE